MATTGTYYHAAHWHHLTRQPLAPICFFPIESAFEYSHQLNIAWHSQKITVA